MLLRVRDPDRGSSFVEYAGVVMVVAALVGAVVFSGVADGAGQRVADGIHEAFGGDPAESVENTSGGGDDGGGGDGGGSSDDGGDGGGDDGDDGCGWNLFCHGGNAVDAASDGVSDAWEWTTETAAPQVGGFFSGLGGAFWDDLTGLGDIFTTNPIETFNSAVETVKEDPLSLLISQEAREAWGNGDYGEAIGMGTWDLGSWLIPGAGWAAKVGKLGKFGNNGNNGNNNNDGNNNDQNNEDNDGNNRNDDEDSSSGITCSRGNSFVPGTEVLMADGSRVATETVDVGDEVWAFDPATGEEGPRAVTDLIDSAGQKTLVDVTVTDAAGETGSVTATDEHPFWAPQAGEWVEAADLDQGTWLRTSAGTWVQVSAVDVRTVDDQQTHNLTVEGLHTYYVGAGDNTTLVHNDDCKVPGGGLREHENRGGHTIDRHVGKDETWLRRRVQNEDLDQASSFRDRETAETAISNSLFRNDRRINDWLDDADDTGQLVIKKDPAGGNIGPIVRRDGTVKDARKVTIVLRKDPDSSTGYRIHTAYPEK